MKKLQKGNMKKIVAGLMCLAMMGSLAGCGGDDKKAEAADEMAMASNDEQEITDVLKNSLGVGSETDADKRKQ